MNNQYRIVWNDSTQTWMAVAETARSHGKSRGSRTGTAAHNLALVLRPLAMALAVWCGLVHAAPPVATQLPTGGQVVAGQATISQAGQSAVLNVNQTSASAVINWNTFNLGSAASVNFAQPDRNAAVLNRVLDANPSQIYGRISAPGQVFFSNPNGMYFAPTASVDVGGLVATTHSISTADFMAGNYRFTRDGATGAIVNEGQLQATLGGYVALLAPEVRNHGVVLAQMGAVALAAGESYQLQIQGSRLSQIDVTPATIRTLVENGQAVLAPEGWIVLSAKAAQQLEASVVNTGQIAANSLTERGGRIVLESTGTVTAGGSIQGNSVQGQGGRVTITGEHIRLPAESDIQATGASGGGTVLVGGDWQGSNGVPQATRVTMDAGARIDASATQNGNGGKVVLWSDVHKADGQTTVHGSISARAGAQGGDGGQIETSGHQVDIAGARIDAGADHGQGGLWLLDPYNYTIGAAEATTILGSLDAGTSFTVDTTNASGSGLTGSAGAGVITVNSAIGKTAGGATTLTLNAADSIVLNAGVSSSSNALGVSMTANAGSISGTGNLALNGGTATFNQATTGVYSGVLSGTGTALTKTGAGTLTLAGTNSYTGATTINNGTVQVGNHGTTGSLGTGSVSLASNGTLAYDRTDDLSQNLNISGSGNLVQQGSNTLTFTNTFGNNANYSGALTINAGQLTLSSANVNHFYGRAININNGSVLGITSTGGLNQYWFGTNVIFDANGGGSVKLLNATTNWVADGLTFTTNGGLQNRIYSSVTASWGLNTNSANAAGVTFNTAAGTNTATADLSVDVPLVNGGAIIKNGAGSVVITAEPSSGLTMAAYSTVAVNAGTYKVGNGGAYGKLGTGNVSLASGTNLVFNITGNMNLPMFISGAGNLVQNGSGITILFGPNTYTGTTQVNRGTLMASGTAAFGNNSAVTLANVAGAKLDLNGYNVSIGSLAGGGTTGGNVTLGSGRLTTGGDASTTTFAGVISGTGGLTKTGSGAFTLSGANTYSGTTTISAGTLQVGNGGSSGQLGAGAVVDNATLVFNRSDDVTVANAISGTGVVTKQGSNTLTLTANSSYGGATHINGGTLVMQNDAPTTGTSGLDGTGSLVIQPNGTSFSAPFSMAGWAPANTLTGLTLGKAGNTAGITLPNAISIAGPINLIGGDLAINAALTATGSNTISLSSSGAVTDGAGGALSANKLLLSGGNVTLDSSSNAIGTLAATGLSNLNFVNGAALTLGTVGATNGVSASGVVNLSTTTGDLTVSQAVSTSNTTANALTLNAGSASAALTSTGGNLLINGSGAVSVGAGGTAKLYSGSISDSTGLATLVGGSGSGRFRYGSDETTTNYTLALGTGLNAIYRQQPTITRAVNSQTVTYGDALTQTFTVSDSLNGDTYSQAFGSATAPTVTVGGSSSTSGKPTVGTHTLSATGGASSSQLGYAVSTTTTSGTLTVNPKQLRVTYTGANKTYDGSQTATVTSSDDRLTGDVLTVSETAAFTDKNVGTNTTVNVSGASLSGADAGNYVLASNSGVASANITAKVLTITGLQVTDKTYDGSTNTTVTNWGQVNTGVGSETLSLNHGLAVFDSANAGSRTADASGYSLVNGANGGLASNYLLSSTHATASATIAKAALQVVANNDAKFITTSDAAGYAGVSYSGFVNGETAAVLGSLPSVSRTNSSVNTAGTYTGVLVPAGGTASNYSFSYTPGDYTVVPANQLLVRMNPLTTTYGTAPSYAIASASYYDPGAQKVVTLTDASMDANNVVTVNDGVGGRASFSVGPRSSSLSSAQQLRAGVYALGVSGAVTENSQNFSDTITLVGSHTVNAKALAVASADGVSKIYDGNTSMNGANFVLNGVGGASGVVNGDIVNAIGSGEYTSRNAGTQLGYAVNNLSLSGADASNYYIATGSSFSGTNGTITPRALTLKAMPDSKMFDGTNGSSVMPVSDALAPGDSLSGLAQAFDSNAVGLRSLNVSAYSVNDGNGGGNYTVMRVPATGGIWSQEMPQPTPLRTTLSTAAPVSNEGVDANSTNTSATTAFTLASTSETSVMVPSNVRKAIVCLDGFVLAHPSEPAAADSTTAAKPGNAQDASCLSVQSGRDVTVK